MSWEKSHPNISRCWIALQFHGAFDFAGGRTWGALKWDVQEGKPMRGPGRGLRQVLGTAARQEKR